MKNRTFARLCLALGVCALTASTFSGCGAVGPASLSRGRAAYNEVLTKTRIEQSLSYLVRLRYGVLSTMLGVSSITANVRFRANAGVNVGVGPGAGYAGNLVPLSGGFAYEENPTISYLPVEGEKQLRRFVSPISLDLFVPVFNSFFDPSPVLIILTNRINRLPNPAFLAPSREERDHRFENMAGLAGELALASVIRFVQGAEKGDSLYLWIHDYAPTYIRPVRQLLDLLDLQSVSANGEDIFLALSPGHKEPAAGSISIHTRSLHRLARIGAASVEIPDVESEKILAAKYPKLGRVGDEIRIRSSKERPANAFCATKYRNWWYYIDAGDHRSRLFFGIFDTLMGYQLAEAAKGSQAAPLLMIPVGQ